MPLSFVLDEHLRGPLWSAIANHNSCHEYTIDAVRVGDLDDLPLGTDDAEILAWTDRHLRLLVTRDKRTMPRHLRNHLDSGGHTPGVLLVRDGCSYAELVEYLDLIAHVGDPADFRDSVAFIPS